jgi:shikimate O-hydroxycinnamoyltransferase
MHHVEYDPPPPLNTHISGDQTPEIQSNPEPTCAKILTITFDQLRTLKNKSRKDVADGSTINYSTFETLAAHIWQCTCKARGITNDQATKLHIPTDGRSRLNPPLPAGYCGNVLFTAAILGLSGEIQSKPLVDTIAKIRGALKRMDNEYLRSAIDYLQLIQADLEALKRGPHTFKSPNLNIVSWMTMPIYDADFGWGRPYFMGPAIVGFEGMAYIARCPNNDGSLMIFTCLESNHMELFKKFFYDF